VVEFVEFDVVDWLVDGVVVELPMDEVKLGYSASGPTLAATAATVVVDVPAKGGGVASPTPPYVLRLFRPKN
jgi:hypothetical protein